MKEDQKTFVAEFGNPNARQSLFGGSTSTTVLVIADDYNQAAAKAELYLDTVIVDEKKSILDGDGSLKDLENNEPQLVSLRLSQTKIIW